MEILDVNQEFVDIFGGTPAADPAKTAFGGEFLNTDLFNSTTETTTVASTTETTTDSSTTETTTVDADLETTANQPGRRPKYDFTDTSGYFADRIKSGKFVAIEEEDAEGNPVQFIPKTPEDFDEVIDIQVNYQLEQKMKNLNDSWYGSKSPAWQAVAKYAEMTDDPSEIIPFLSGVRTIDSVSNIDENEIDGAEKIVRVRLQQRGETPDMIEEQIEALKTTDRLIKTAQSYKPAIIKEEQQHLSQLANEKRREEIEYSQLVSSIRENAIKAIETPIFGKQKLKQDEKAAIYSLIAQPDPNSKGYQIYSAIDNLFETGNFEKLKKVALLLAKEEAFSSYISSSAANTTAENLQRKLRVSTESRAAGSTGNDNGEDADKRTVQRTQYNQTPRFGR